MKEQMSAGVFFLLSEDRDVVFRKHPSKEMNELIVEPGSESLFVGYKMLSDPYAELSQADLPLNTPRLEAMEEVASLFRKTFD